MIPQLDGGRARRPPLYILCHIPRFPVLVSLPEHLLVELSDAGFGHGVDDLDLVGQRPAGELRAQEVDDLPRLDDAPGLRHHASEGPLDPLRVGTAITAASRTFGWAMIMFSTS